MDLESRWASIASTLMRAARRLLPCSLFTPWSSEANEKDPLWGPGVCVVTGHSGSDLHGGTLEEIHGILVG